MPIPNHAKKVFEGISIDVYHWPQKQFDGSVKTFESVVRRPGVQIFATVGDKILLSKEEHPNREPFCGPVGGLCDEGESALEAAKRELLEETGMVSEDWEVFSVHQSEGRFQVNTTNFIARNCTKITEQDLDAGEKLEVLTLTFEEFFDYVKNPCFRNKNLAVDLLRMALDEREKDAFKRKLFTKSI